MTLYFHVVEGWLEYFPERPEDQRWQELPAEVHQGYQNLTVRRSAFYEQFWIFEIQTDKLSRFPSINIPEEFQQEAFNYQTLKLLSQ